MEFGYPLLYVNFDPLLVRLLREVKYFLLLGFEAPQAALEIYEHAETFRKHMGNLDLVVLTQRDFQPFPNFNFASMASTRRHATATPSRWL